MPELKQAPYDGAKRRRILGVGLALVLTGAAARAQTNAEVSAGIQFNFSVPGARSLGLGGAFLGLADDATAAYANPAGLTNLSLPEVSLEARNWSFSNEFTDRGRLSGEPTGEGVDSVRGLRSSTSDDSTMGASYFSFVYPGSQWALALYRHELANYEAGFDSQGALIDTETRLFPARNSLNLEIINFGLSGAYRLNDALSLGIGLSYYTLEIDSQSSRYDFESFEGTGPGTFLGRPRFADDNVFDVTTQRADDQQIAVNAGFNWKIDRNWRIGGVYRHGPTFDFETTYSSGPRQASRSSISRQAHFNIPDVLGIGGAYQPTEFATISMDYFRIEYSELAQQVINLFPRVDDEGVAGYRIDDADELHLGFEYVFPLSRALFAARMGAWHDPDHKMFYEGDSLERRALFLRGEDEIHYSAGFGWIGERFQVDVAVDISDRVSASALSTVVRF